MADPSPPHCAHGDADGRMRRRALLGLLTVAPVSIAAMVRIGNGDAPGLEPVGPDEGSRDDWRAFAARFIAPEGRVIDTGNGGVTHSEGQGYGLLFAEHFADREMFDRLLTWTRTQLRRPTDSLHAWRYRPGAATPVDDRNNATDGDLLIALALLRAGRRWDDESYTTAGSAIGGDILAFCVHEVDGARVLLPAAFGFEHPGRVVVNPSYYVFPALTALAMAAPNPAWEALRSDGLRILRRARFGRWRLPPDWVQIDSGSLDTMAPAAGWPARFSWDAVRIPLHLAWAGLTDEPAFWSAAEFWTAPREGGVPAWVDLGTGSVAPYPASGGVAAIAELARAARPGAAAPNLPHIRATDDYYSAALTLLSRMVWHERRAATAIAATG